MDPATPKPEGSTRIGNLDADLVAACLPAEAGTVHWAFGMPLSYVHEMASHWLSLYDRTAKLAAPAVSDENRVADSQAGDG